MFSVRITNHLWAHHNCSCDIHQSHLLVVFQEANPQWLGMFILQHKRIWSKTDSYLFFRWLSQSFIEILPRFSQWLRENGCLIFCAACYLNDGKMIFPHHTWIDQKMIIQSFLMRDIPISTKYISSVPKVYSISFYGAFIPTITERRNSVAISSSSSSLSQCGSCNPNHRKVR